VFCSIEGTRPLLCEIQALTNFTPMPQPRRTSIGFDVNRVHLLTAVLNKHLGLRLANADVFINVVGGLKLIEPAADLAVAAALISTETEKEIGAKTCFFGEIGLTGEVRAVSMAEARLKEANKLGFTQFVLPFSNRKHLAEIDPELSKKIVWIKDIQELTKLFGGDGRRMAGKTAAIAKAREERLAKEEAAKAARSSSSSGGDGLDF
jgi:DNA repair protein RadA/Sms